MTRLNDVKVGDPVCLVHRHQWNGQVSLLRGVVERVTATQVITLEGRRFKKADGVEVGQGRSSWRAPDVLSPITQELLDEEADSDAKRQALRKCRDWSERLERARGSEAVRLANMLPDLPERGLTR